MDFLPLFLLWLAGLLTTCTILHLWFTTSLPIELVILLNSVGLLKEQVLHRINGQPLTEMLRHEFDTWLVLLETKHLVNRRLSHIMQCRGCLSVHAAWLTMTTLMLLTGVTFELGWRANLCCWLLGPATWPWLACKLTAFPYIPAKK